MSIKTFIFFLNIQLLVWKSNLHTYDISLYEAKLAREPLNESGVLPHQPQTAVCNTTTTNSSDQSIIIDSRQSVAYNKRDENFQVLESEFIKHNTHHITSSPCSTASATEQSSLLKFPKNKNNFFDDYPTSSSKKSFSNASSKYF